jgi:transcription antitermination protein NusB
LTDSGAKAPPTKSARRRSREIALQGLYQWLLSASDSQAILLHMQTAPGYEKCDKPYLQNLVEGVIRDAISLEAQLSPCLDRDAEALSPVERAALLIGAFELAHHAEVPYRVVLNEAVELSKSFGGSDGFRYVNGVLDKLAAQLRSHEFRR